MSGKNCTVNCEYNSETVFAIKKLSKTQRNRVSLQFTDRVFSIVISEKNRNKNISHFSTAVMALLVSINFQNFTTFIAKYIDCKNNVTLFFLIRGRNE